MLWKLSRFFHSFSEMSKNALCKHFANTMPRIVEEKIWPIEKLIFFYVFGRSSRGDLIQQINRTEAQVKVLEMTCMSALLCELYVVGSNETAQVCAVKYMYEYEQCWNVKMQFAAGKFA